MKKGKEMTSQELLQPILDVCTGADGGIAFIRLRGIIEQENEQVNVEIMKIHRLCKYLLEQGTEDL